MLHECRIVSQSLFLEACHLPLSVRLLQNTVRQNDQLGGPIAQLEIIRLADGTQIPSGLMAEVKVAANFLGP
jgi:hypothetical protein